MEDGYVSLSGHLEVFVNSSRKVKLAEEKEKGRSVISLSGRRWGDYRSRWGDMLSLQVIGSGSDAEAAAESAAREAQVLHQLRHPHIVQSSRMMSLKHGN